MYIMSVVKYLDNVNMHTINQEVCHDVFACNNMSQGFNISKERVVAGNIARM